MNTYEIRYKLERIGNVHFDKVKAESIDEVSKNFRMNTYLDHPDAIILSIRKEKEND